MRWIYFFVLSIVLCTPGLADEAESTPVLATDFVGFSRINPTITPSMALHIQAKVERKKLRVEVYVVIDHPFEKVATALQSGKKYCVFLLLNMNVKSCLHAKVETKNMLRIYVAGKKYTPRYRTIRIDTLQYTAKRAAAYLKVILEAKKGEVGAKEFRTIVEAAPMNGKTLIHVVATYRPNMFNRVATATYLRTFAKGKVGFTVTGVDENGVKQYIKGMPALIERNAVRSLLAFSVYLDTTHVPVERRFREQLIRWHQLTGRFRHQLYEQSYKDYLTIKIREYERQQKMQAKFTLKMVDKSGQ